MSGYQNFLLVILMTAFSAVIPAKAADEGEETADPALIAKELNDPVAFGAYLDQEVLTGMETHKVAGVVLSIVKDGKLYYSNGYGMADQEKNIAVDGQTTLFRPGSISKTFTWTAIMQLVEQGKVDLEADVNAYLKTIKVPDTFPEPIKVKHLLAHTPGYEAPGLGHLFENDPSQVLSLEKYLQKFIPERVRPSGKLYAYSNYGTALAGQIIADVSGMSFEDYMDKNILGPLGMKDSTFREPLGEGWPNNMPVDLASRVSQGFAPLPEGGYKQDGFTFISGIGPAGGLSATAPDMAKFIMAHLNHGQLEGRSLLRPETADLMHSRNYDFSSGKAFGSSHGFINYNYLGHNRIGHDGGTVHFESQMGIYPDLNFGIFISTNTSGGSALHSEIEKLVIKRYFGDKTPTVEEILPPKDFAGKYEKFEGSYLHTRRVYSNIEILASFFNGITEIEASPEGYLLVKGAGPEPTKIVEVSPLLFRAVDKERYYEFVEGDNGAIAHLKAISTYDKVAWYQRPDVKILVILVSVISIIIAFIAFLIKSYRKSAALEVAPESFARKSLLWTTGAWVIFYGLFIINIMKISKGGFPFDFPSTLFIAVLVVGVVATLLSFVTIYALLPLWKKKCWGPVWRSFYAFICLLLFVMMLTLNSLHLIGFNYY